MTTYNVDLSPICLAINSLLSFGSILVCSYVTLRVLKDAIAKIESARREAEELRGVVSKQDAWLIACANSIGRHVPINQRPPELDQIIDRIHEIARKQHEEQPLN